jgi:predicted nucleic acid-binding protein
VNLIVDTNIAISSLITPGSNISKIIFRDLGKSALIAPSFMFEEILDKFQRIIKITGYSDEQLKELLYLLVKRIDFIENELIDFKHQKEAYDLVKEIDPKDLLFVALSLQTGKPIWTGDFKLHKGLRKRGFDNILTTNEIIQRIKE